MTLSQYRIISAQGKLKAYGTLLLILIKFLMLFDRRFKNKNTTVFNIFITSQKGLISARCKLKAYEKVLLMLF